MTNPFFISISFGYCILYALLVDWLLISYIPSGILFGRVHLKELITELLGASQLSTSKLLLFADLNFKTIFLFSLFINL